MKVLTGQRSRSCDGIRSRPLYSRSHSILLRIRCDTVRAYRTHTCQLPPVLLARTKSINACGETIRSTPQTHSWCSQNAALGPKRTDKNRCSKNAQRASHRFHRSACPPGEERSFRSEGASATFVRRTFIGHCNIEKIYASESLILSSRGLLKRGVFG